MVDAGVVRVTVDDLSFNGELQIDPNNQGKLQISVKDLQIDFNPEKLRLQIDCYSDLTKYIMEDVQFYKNFMIKRFLKQYKSTIECNVIIA